jgi:hypothetical protein
MGGISINKLIDIIITINSVIIIKSKWIIIVTLRIIRTIITVIIVIITDCRITIGY